jgi:parvulin-like peptidyl-prolyl isomerase
LANDISEKIITELKEGSQIENITEKYQIEVKESDYFQRYGFIKEIGYAPKVAQTAFSLEKSEWEKVTASSGEIFIIQTLDIEEPSEEDFPEMEDRIKSSLLAQKKQEAFMSWLEQLRERQQDKIFILWDKFK